MGISLPGSNVSCMCIGNTNKSLSRFIDWDQKDIFEVVICRIDEKTHPEHQVDINIYIKKKGK